MKRYFTIDLEPESIYYDVITYPAGEIQVRLSENSVLAVEPNIRITSRRTDGNGLLLLALLVSAIRSVNENVCIELFFPYLPFGRADRRFVAGDCAGLETFGALVNSIEPFRVKTLDAHSEGAADAYIQSLVNVPARDLIERVIVRWGARHGGNTVVVLFPDDGAASRYDVPDQVGDKQIVKLFATKKRDPATGKLSGFEVPGWAKRTKHVLIVDDICDGGGTFLGIAAELPGVELGLYVTHGIFSQGLEKLGKVFSTIYTTDSVKATSHAVTFSAGEEVERYDARTY